MRLAFEPYLSTSPQATQAFGERLAAELEPGDVVALYGNLGAGKTHFVRGMCIGLGVDPARVSSPTFALVQEYRGDRVPVYHIDAYRIEQVSEFFELGYEEYFYGDGVCLVEWPERIASLLPDGVIRIELGHVDESSRSIWRRDGARI